MIFLSLHYGGPHANPAKRVVWGEGGTTEWSLFRRADAVGGLKGPARPRRSLRGLGGVSHQQASAGIYRRIACRYRCC